MLCVRAAPQLINTFSPNRQQNAATVWQSLRSANKALSYSLSSANSHAPSPSCSFQINFSSLIPQFPPKSQECFTLGFDAGHGSQVVKVPDHG
ncbi:hypothetical protein TNCT_202071 [Trichonephila clavata]|uniref:Uncharacterized protein n=1 Tax=Trichonephila clavata TaxID=2740835 RepID=A0A8X6JAS6_TRICU|nr:hypothetical protein TNCT_202071 [Trichonephila clavata]